MKGKKRLSPRRTLIVDDEKDDKEEECVAYPAANVPKSKAKKVAVKEEPRDEQYQHVSLERVDIHKDARVFALLDEGRQTP